MSILSQFAAHAAEFNGTFAQNSKALCETAKEALSAVQTLQAKLAEMLKHVRPGGKDQHLVTELEDTLHGLSGKIAALLDQVKTMAESKPPEAPKL